jgi:N-acetylglucosaminyl-diphospho-decaprenol L-rhamnosyltransferase
MTMTAASPPSVDAMDIVVVSYNTIVDLDRCLSSVLEHPPAHLADLMVVDNASTDGSADMVRQRFPGVRLVALDRNLGFAAANNLAIRRSKAPLVLLLNSDTIVPAGALDVLRDRLLQTGAVAAGPRLVDGNGRPELSFGPMLSPLAELRQRRRIRQSRSVSPAARRAIDRLLSRERDVDWVTGACLLVTRTAAEGAGLLDERYFMYEEDVDFCAALRSRGGRILFTPRTTVVHLRGRSAESAGAVRSAHYDRSHLAFYEKHLPRWAPILRFWQKLRPRVP